MFPLLLFSSPISGLSQHLSHPCRQRDTKTCPCGTCYRWYLPTAAGFNQHACRYSQQNFGFRMIPGWVKIIDLSNMDCLVVKTILSCMHRLRICRRMYRTEKTIKLFGYLLPLESIGQLDMSFQMIQQRRNLQAKMCTVSRPLHTTSDA
jgi:hypothetical protein